MKLMVDSDNAGHVITRRSTVCQGTFLGDHVETRACNLVQIIGLSSAEDDYYATSSNSSSHLGLQSLLHY